MSQGEYYKQCDKAACATSEELGKTQPNLLCNVEKTSKGDESILLVNTLISLHTLLTLNQSDQLSYHSVRIRRHETHWSWLNIACVITRT